MSKTKNILKNIKQGTSSEISELEEKEKFLVLLKSGKKIRISEDGFALCKKELEIGRRYIFFSDAVLVASEIETIIKESTYNKNKEGLL